MDLLATVTVASISTQSSGDAGALDAPNFTHPNPAYKFLGEQSNITAEKTPHFVHTTEFLIRTKESFSKGSHVASPCVSEEEEEESEERILYSVVKE